MRSVASHFETKLRLTDIARVRAIQSILHNFFTFAEIPVSSWSFTDSRRFVDFDLSTWGQNAVEWDIEQVCFTFNLTISPFRVREID